MSKYNKNLKDFFDNQQSVGQLFAAMDETDRLEREVRRKKYPFSIEDPFWEHERFPDGSIDIYNEQKRNKNK